MLNGTPFFHQKFQGFRGCKVSRWTPEGHGFENLGSVKL